MKSNCFLMLALTASVLVSGCATKPELAQYPANSLVIQNRSPYEIVVSRVGMLMDHGRVAYLAERFYPKMRVAAHDTLVLTDLDSAPERVSVRLTAEKHTIVGGVPKVTVVGSQSRLVDHNGGPAKVIVVRKFWDF